MNSHYDHGVISVPVGHYGLTPTPPTPHYTGPLPCIHPAPARPSLHQKKSGVWPFNAGHTHTPLGAIGDHACLPANAFITLLTLVFFSSCPLHTHLLYTSLSLSSRYTSLRPGNRKYHLHSDQTTTRPRVNSELCPPNHCSFCFGRLCLSSPLPCSLSTCQGHRRLPDLPASRTFFTQASFLLVSMAKKVARCTHTLLVSPRIFHRRVFRLRITPTAKPASCFLLDCF